MKILYSSIFLLSITVKMSFTDSFFKFQLGESEVKLTNKLNSLNCLYKSESVTSVGNNKGSTIATLPFTIITISNLIKGSTNFSKTWILLATNGVFSIQHETCPLDASSVTTELNSSKHEFLTSYNVFFTNILFASNQVATNLDDPKLIRYLTTNAIDHTFLYTRFFNGITNGVISLKAAKIKSTLLNWAEQRRVFGDMDQFK